MPTLPYERHGRSALHNVRDTHFHSMYNKRRQRQKLKWYDWSPRKQQLIRNICVFIGLICIVRLHRYSNENDVDSYLELSKTHSTGTASVIRTIERDSIIRTNEEKADQMKYLIDQKHQQEGEKLEDYESKTTVGSDDTQRIIIEREKPNDISETDMEAEADEISGEVETELEDPHVDSEDPKDESTDRKLPPADNEVAVSSDEKKMVDLDPRIATEEQVLEEDNKQLKEKEMMEKEGVGASQTTISSDREVVASTSSMTSNAVEEAPSSTAQDEPLYYYYYYYDQLDENGNPRVVKGKELDKFKKTGSFANCNEGHATSTKHDDPKKDAIDNHPESGTVVVSCRQIHYRAPLAEIEQGGMPIVVGVLSGAGGKGPLQRDSIRSTWAKDRKGVYFLVAGPWDQIADEFEKYRDLIWIDEEEIYEGEKSVLPFKTESFMYILYKHTLAGQSEFKYLFKTDDDSYVNLEKLEEMLLRQRNEMWHYWGCCTTRQFAPLRDTTLKWHVTYEMYPEDMYPLYCQGAGFATSREFVKCMVDENHMQQIRYNPFEDVSIGLLAERCNIYPISDHEAIRQYRSDEGSTKMLAVDKNAEQVKQLPQASMLRRVLQHRVKTHNDMYAHHKCVREGC